MALPFLCQELLSIPTDAPADYEWDQWEIQSYFFFGNTDELERFSRLTGRANIALALAVCEWIAARLRPLSGDTDLDDYLESGWAALIDVNYSQGVELPFEEWAGPVLAPQLIAIGIINDAFFESDDDPEMEWRSCYAINLARYVLPPDTRFEDWLERSVQRLEQFHSWHAEGDIEEDIFAPEVYQGGPVGRELFDHTKDYNSQDAARQLNSLMYRMNPENEYLYLPDIAAPN